MTIFGLVMVLSLFTQSMGEVERVFDKTADFTAYRTYAWSEGREADDPATHKLIVAAIDTEMARLGFVKAALAAADVTVQYRSVRGLYLEKDALKKTQKQQRIDPADDKIYASMVVQLRPAGSSEPVWEARTRRVLSDDAAVREGELKTAIAELFAKYPTVDDHDNDND